MSLTQHNCKPVVCVGGAFSDNLYLIIQTVYVMSSTSAANTEQDKKEGARVIMSPSTFDHDTIATPPPPVPPPPLPMVNIQRRRRIRSFYWKPIPEERVQQRGAPNLWTLANHSDKHKFQIDIKSVEDLFGLNDRHTAATASNKTSRVHRGLPEQNKEVEISHWSLII